METRKTGLKVQVKGDAEVAVLDLVGIAGLEQCWRRKARERRCRQRLCCSKQCLQAHSGSAEERVGSRRAQEQPGDTVGQKSADKLQGTRLRRKKETTKSKELEDPAQRPCHRRRPQKAHLAPGSLAARRQLKLVAAETTTLGRQLEDPKVPWLEEEKKKRKQAEYTVCAEE